MATWLELLASPNCDASVNARLDLKRGIVDARLVDTLWLLTRVHCITITTIKTGHPLGATARSGRSNAHFYGRAVNIAAVAGRAIVDDPASAAALDIGRILHAMPPTRRPDCIMGPEAWQHALGFSTAAGFVSDPFHNRIHADHLHLGFAHESGTANQE